MLTRPAAGLAVAAALSLAGCSAGATTAGDIAPASTPAERGAALTAVDGLEVAGRAPLTGYDRGLFGPAWTDTDRNGCDTRNDILGRDLLEVEVRPGTNDCVVVGGVLPDPYTGERIGFEKSRAGEVHVDHVVALADAWQKGAAQWPPGKRLAFANDPLNLLAVGAGVNQAKGSGDTATWLPPHRVGRCAYVARQVAVKRKYEVRITSAEQVAMRRVLEACPAEALPSGDAPTTAPVRGSG